MEKIKAILFGMTGFGNNALEVLLNHPSIATIAVFTPERQAGPFPYYECEKLHDAVLRSGVALYEGLNFKDEKTYDLIKKLSPDLIVVSSFNQIIPKSIISIPKLGMINIHPSLLPKYRGATPTVCVLLNGEKETGITIHFIENEQIDCGRIISQTTLKIEPDDTDGSIRRKLAKLSEKILIKAIHLILSKNREIFPKQNEAEATYYPKRTLKDAEINLDSPFEDIVKKIRAMSPYPVARLTYNGERYLTTSAAWINDKTIKRNKPDETGSIIVDSLQGKIKFQVRKESK